MNPNTNQNKVFTLQMKKSFKELIDKYLQRYVNKNDSSSKQYECYSDEKIEWYIKRYAYNYHDESWTEYVHLTMQVFESEEGINSSFGEKGQVKDTGYTLFSELIKDIEEHSEAVYIRNNDVCFSIEKARKQMPRYNYSYDIEYIFKSPYGYDIDIYLRCSEYDDR